MNPYLPFIYKRKSHTATLPMQEAIQLITIKYFSKNYFFFSSALVAAGNLDL